MGSFARLRVPLWGGVVLIAAAGLVCELWHHASPSGLSELMQARFSLSFEANLPTWAASSLLIACAIASGKVAMSPAARPRGSWWVVTAAFGFASLDEAIELHEQMGGLIDAGGVLYFDWIVSAAVILAALAVALWPWLRALAPATRRRLVLAGAVYFGGAVVMELPLGWWTDQAGAGSLGYALIDWVEETMELAGAVLMLRALMLHIEEEPTTATTTATTTTATTSVAPAGSGEEP